MLHIILDTNHALLKSGFILSLLIIFGEKNTSFILDIKSSMYPKY
jgi:hypothetical protein